MAKARQLGACICWQESTDQASFMEKHQRSRKHDMGNESARIDADTNEQLLVGT